MTETAYFNASYWAQVFRDKFSKEIDTFATQVIERLLPTFESLEAESDRIIEREFERLGNESYSEYIGMDTLAEEAFTAGLDHYTRMSDVRQALLNLAAAGLYHLFEQQMLSYLRRHILHPSQENRVKLINWSELKKQFRRRHIDLEKLSTWENVDIVRLVANSVKHAEGESSSDLREKRPDFFTREAFRGQEGFLGKPSKHLYTPLNGNGMYIQPTDLRGFAESLGHFWNELADMIEQVESKSLASE